MKVTFMNKNDNMDKIDNMDDTMHHMNEIIFMDKNYHDPYFLISSTWATLFV